MTDLKLMPKGNSYILSRSLPDGTSAEIALSEENVISLAQSARRLMDHILAQHTPKEGSVAPIATTPVAQVVLNTDVHRTEILLTMIAPSGAREAYALPLSVAKPLSERLQVKVAEIETAKAVQSKH